MVCLPLKAPERRKVLLFYVILNNNVKSKYFHFRLIFTWNIFGVLRLAFVDLFSSKNISVDMWFVCQTEVLPVVFTEMLISASSLLAAAPWTKTAQAGPGQAVNLGGWREGLTLSGVSGLGLQLLLLSPARQHQANKIVISRKHYSLYIYNQYTFHISRREIKGGKMKVSIFFQDWNLFFSKAIATLSLFSI